MTHKHEATARRVFETPVGRIGVEATARGLARVTLPNGFSGAAVRRAGGGKRGEAPDPKAQKIAARAEKEIIAYLVGRLRRFTVPLDTAGVPPFHARVMRAAAGIPYGRTATYGDLARRAGSPGAARAAGQAMARNPLALVVPCHRVVASVGLGGYGGGLDLKRRLLAMESGRSTAGGRCRCCGK
jgi:methylated-DNA-[protein]-cysteine S-methyltransferase